MAAQTAAQRAVVLREQRIGRRDRRVRNARVHRGQRRARRARGRCRTGSRSAGRPTGARSSSACAMRRVPLERRLIGQARHAPAASRAARNVRSGARSAHCTSRCVSRRRIRAERVRRADAQPPAVVALTIVSGGEDARGVGRAPRMRRHVSGPRRGRKLAGNVRPFAGQLHEQRRRPPALAVLRDGSPDAGSRTFAEADADRRRTSGRRARPGSRSR